MIMNIYEIIQNKILERLTESEANGTKFHWVKPFDFTSSVRYPCNYETSKPYSGVNRLLPPDEYITFTKIQEMNQKDKSNFWHIRKGAKAAMVVYYNWQQAKDKDGNLLFDEEGNVRMIPYVKFFNVFDRSDIVNKDGDNLPSRIPVKHFSHDDIDRITQSELLRFTSMVNYYCQEHGIELQIVTDSRRAYYSPSENIIRIPTMANFDSVYDYVHTVAHELAHSTGIELGRFKNNSVETHEEYSKEELVAEIAASMIIASFRIEDDSAHKDNDIAYVQSWRKHIAESDTKKLIVAASQHAAKASSLVTGVKLREHYLETIANDISEYENVPDFIRLDIEFSREAVKANPLVWDMLNDEHREELSDEIGDRVTVSNTLECIEDR